MYVHRGRLRISLAIMAFLVVQFDLLAATDRSRKGGIHESAAKEVIAWEGGEIIKYQLKNGLTVVLQESHATPVVALNMWVKTGSANEIDKEAGISHIFEHMLFKGTQRRPVGMIAQEVESAGGVINAFTTFDHTVYYLVLASRFFDTGLDILADAIQNSSFDPQELEKEKEVVMEEWRRYQDMPSSTLSDKIFSTSYQKHPYGRPVIGYPETIQAVTRDQMLAYFHQWYIPNNMTLVITGDFDTETVTTKIEEAFQDFESRPDPQRERETEPPQQELRGFVLTRPINQSYMSLAFHIPDIKNIDLYPLDVLALILGQGESSRLYHQVKVEKQSVHTIYSYAYTPKDPGLMIIGAALDPKQFDQALQDILRETYRLRYEEVSPEEVEKAKINLESDFIYQRETVQGLARNLGYFETVTGDVAYQKEYLKRIAEVTPADIQRVAKLYLKNTNLTVGLLLPQNNSLSIDVAHIRQLTEKSSAEIEAQQKQAPPIPDASNQGGVQKVVLENGLTLLIKENHTTPVVAINAVFLGGLRFETPENNGVNNFMAAMLTKGTTTRTSLQIATEIESIAGSIDGFSGQNSFGITAKILKRYFNEGLELMADILLHPSFDPVELEKERADILAAIQRQEDSLSHYAFNLFAQTLYHRHPYGMDVLGTPETVRKMTSQDLIDFYRRYAVAQNLVLAVVGDVNPEVVTDKVKRIFEDIPSGPFQLPEIPQEAPAADIRSKEAHKERNQAHIVLGFLGTTLANKDRYPLEVLNAILSGQGGRLFMELRDRQSLAYSVSSFSREGLDSGSFGVYIGTSPDKVDKAIEGIKKELKQVTVKPVSSEELERAKKYLVGTYEIGLQSNSSQASDISFNERYALGHDFYQKYVQEIYQVTAEDILQVAQKYIQLDRYIMAIVRPESTP